MGNFVLLVSYIRQRMFFMLKCTMKYRNKTTHVSTLSFTADSSLFLATGLATLWPSDDDVEDEVLFLVKNDLQRKNHKNPIIMFTRTYKINAYVIDFCDILWNSKPLWIVFGFGAAAKVKLNGFRREIPASLNLRKCSVVLRNKWRPDTTNIKRCEIQRLNTLSRGHFGGQRPQDSLCLI